MGDAAIDTERDVSIIMAGQGFRVAFFVRAAATQFHTIAGKPPALSITQPVTLTGNRRLLGAGDLL